MSRLYHVNAFSHRPSGGNPAVVVLGDTARRRAAGHGGGVQPSESAFLTRLGGALWVALVHPASGGGLVRPWHPGGGPRAVADGEVPGSSHPASRPAVASCWPGGRGRIWLDFPRISLAPLELDPAWGGSRLPAAAHAGGRGPSSCLSWPAREAVHALTPDFHGLRALPGRGIMVTAPSSDPDHDFVSRYFAPWVGVEEDPVTGSNHCALVPFWAERLGKTRLKARQISARGGELRLILQGRVLMAGRALTLWQGRGCCRRRYKAGAARPGSSEIKTPRSAGVSIVIALGRNPAGITLLLRTQGREQDDVADGVAVGEQHHQAVDTDALTGGGRQTVFQRGNEVGVVEHGFVVPCGFLVNLGLERSA